MKLQVCLSVKQTNKNREREHYILAPRRFNRKHRKLCRWGPDIPTGRWQPVAAGTSAVAELLGGRHPPWRGDSLQLTWVLCAQHTQLLTFQGNQVRDGETHTR